MIFNRQAIAAKERDIDAILNQQELLQNVIREFAGDGADFTYRLTKRPWEPGGGSTLFSIQCVGRNAFLKVKSTEVIVESRLECEEKFIEVPSLQNEYHILREIRGITQNIPRVLKYTEKDGFNFLFIEELKPFATVVDQLSIPEMLTTYEQIEHTLRKLFEKNIVHTDVHESNLMFRDNIPVLIDFEEARYLVQDTPFEQSLDVAGESAQGNVGQMPVVSGSVSGFTCLNRLRVVFAQGIAAKLPGFIKTCNFDSSCPFLKALDHGKDERIYQSINLPGSLVVEGQRPLEDSRIELTLRIAERLFKNSFSHLDIGSNLGRVNLELAKNPQVRKSVGVEAYDRYVHLSNALAFLSNSKKVEFLCAECGKDSLEKLLHGQTVELVTIYSVYHHITNREAFLKDLAKLKPSYVLIEMAVQDECYGKSWQAELSYICGQLNMRHSCLLTLSKDYNRPIILISNTPNVDYLLTSDQFDVLEQRRPEPIVSEKRPSVSVVLPTYNHLPLLPAAIESVLAQTLSDFELIIVNDGSTDGTRKYLDNLSDARIRVIHQENSRLPNALNTGFQAACGRYLTWTSDDNYCSPLFLESLVNALEAEPSAGFAYSAFAWIDEHDRILGVQKNQDLSWTNLVAANPGIASFLYRRECMETVGPYDTTLEGAEDWDMWLRITEHFGTMYVPEVLYYYRLHTQSMTNRKRAQIQVAVQKTFEKTLSRKGNTLNLKQLYPWISRCEDQKRATNEALLDFGTKLLRSGFPFQLGLACQLLELALSMYGDSAGTAYNLAIAYARSEQMNKVSALFERIARSSEVSVKEAAARLQQAIESNNPAAILQLPVLMSNSTSTELQQIMKKQRKTYSLTSNHSSAGLVTIPKAAPHTEKPSLEREEIVCSNEQMPSTKSQVQTRNNKHQSLKVTYLINSILGITGGNQTLLKQANALTERGHSVTIVTCSDKPDWYDINASIIKVIPPNPMSSYVPPSDVVISTFFDNAPELLNVDARAKVYYAQGDQYIFEDDTPAVNPKMQDFRAKLKQLCSLAYRLPGIWFIANSHNLARAVARKYGRVADAILPVCTDQTIFRPLQRPQVASRMRILVVGPDIKGGDIEPLGFKGIEDIRNALQMLDERKLPFTAVRISGSPMEIFKDFPCEYYQAPTDEMKTFLFGTAHILVYASHYDSCPRPPQEAMATGAAVVCTATPGAMEYCVHEENCLLVPIKSPISIADAVQRIMLDKPLRERLVNGGFELARQYPREREWDELERLLIKYVNGASRL